MTENHNSATKRLIHDAGISTGKRVLDLGCGKGDVSLLLAEAVGPTGEVLGIDRNDNMLKAARSRVKADSVTNIKFLNVDLSKTLPEMGTYDVIFGRRVLMYLPNPEQVLKSLLDCLKDDGIVAFQEIDSTVSSIRTSPLPLHEKANNWIWSTIKKEGGDTNIGFALSSLLSESGIIIDDIKAEASIQGQKSHGSLATVIRAMSHRIVEHNIATEEEIDINTLEQRLNNERPDSSVFISGMSFFVHGRKNNRYQTSSDQSIMGRNG